MLHRAKNISSFLTVLVLTVAFALVAGCGSGNNDTVNTPGTGRVRVVHASPDAPNVDVYVDNQRVLSNVPYQAASGYLPLNAGAHLVRVTPANSETAVISATITVTPNTDYTVLAVGRVANIEPLVLTDDNSAPGAGNIKVRLVHASPAAEAASVDIYVTAPTTDIATTAPTLSSIPFKAASGYLSVPAGSYRVRVTPAGSKTVVIDTGAIALSAGAIRTGVAVGDPAVNTAAGGVAALGAILLSDN
jgi:hypothetical protein